MEFSESADIILLGVNAIVDLHKVDIINAVNQRTTQILEALKCRETSVTTGYSFDDVINISTFKEKYNLSLPSLYCVYTNRT